MEKRPWTAPRRDPRGALRRDGRGRRESRCGGPRTPAGRRRKPDQRGERAGTNL